MSAAPTPAALARLKAFARATPAERCSLCGAVVPSEHPHLLEPGVPGVACACAACALLFHDAAGARRVVIPRAERLHGFVLDEATWSSLAVPIGLVWFVRSSTRDQVTAVYPGPAGVTEAVVSAATWGELVRLNPELTGFSSDVEVLLVNRVDGPLRAYRVSIDRCYGLVGLLRTHWRGLGGGPAVREALTDFFRVLDGGDRA